MDKRELLSIALGVLVGALAGFLYYKYIGCDQGCAITSNPWRSAVYGSFLGGMIGHQFGK